MSYENYNQRVNKKVRLSIIEVYIKFTTDG